MQETLEHPLVAIGESAPAEPEPPGEDVVETSPGSDEPGDGLGERTRSTISFPYVGLAEAETIASEIHRFGGIATPEGIAAALSQTSRSGAFRQKLAAARIFGLVATKPGEVALSQLGNRIIDPEHRASARVQAFLHAPLYEKAFSEYQGNLLPPPDALEARFVAWGVSPKQAGVARQVFQRSAQHAGFFRRGINRLTIPEVATKTPPKDRSTDDGALPAGGTDPVQTLWLTLLREGESWSAEQTKAYVDGARSIYRALSGVASD